MEGRGWGVARSRMSEEWKKETKGGRGGEGIEKERGVEEGRAARTKNPCSTEKNFLLRERIFPAAGNKNYCCSNLWLLQQ